MATRRAVAAVAARPTPIYSGNLQNRTDDLDLSLNESALLDWVNKTNSCKRKAEDDGEGRNYKCPKFDSASDASSSKVPEYDWQSTECGLKKRLAYSLVNKILCDIHFIVGSGSQVQRISAHKYILSVGSVVFETMFNENWSSASVEIEVPDVEPAAFWALIRFLYTDQVIITSDTVMAILYAAKKYAVPLLESQCVDFLIKNLCPDNAFSLLMQARSFDEKKLVNLCLETIDTNTGEAVLADDFPDINLETLCLVLKRNTLKISEIKLFEAVRRWAKAKCVEANLPISRDNLRLILGEALHLIRFPLMTGEQLSSIVEPSKILHDRELLSIFLYLSTNPKPFISFNTKPRAFKELKHLTRFQSAVGGWKCTGVGEESVGFSSDRKIQFMGIGLYGAVHGPADYHVTLELIHEETNVILHSESGHYESEASANMFNVLLKNPIKLKSHTPYIIKAKVKGPKSFYGMGGLRQVSHECQHSGKITMTFKTIEPIVNTSFFTSMSKGQIPQILFYL